MGCQSNLLGAGDVRRLAEALQIHPRKALGQNFVVDGNTIRRIVRVAQLTADEHVVEVGPGLGSLTLGLLSEVEQVTAIELDGRLAGALIGTVTERAPECVQRLDVLVGDAADREVLARVPGGPSALVANLPYNVAVPILLNCMQAMPTVRHGVVMVQTEVAERLAAGPGSKAYGVPSLKLAWYARARMAGHVPAGVFWPVPRVGSSLVAFERRSQSHSAVDRLRVFDLINEAFGQRRKMLRATLKGRIDSQVLARVLDDRGLPDSARPEVLTLEDFIAIAEACDEPIV